MFSLSQKLLQLESILAEQVKNHEQVSRAELNFLRLQMEWLSREAKLLETLLPPPLAKCGPSSCTTHIHVYAPASTKSNKEAQGVQLQ